MNIEHFREKVRSYRTLTGNTQEELAKVLGLNPQVLSHKLHGVRNARLTQREVQTIVSTLVQWGVMTRQAQARELLELMECPDFPLAAWHEPPLNRLEAATSTYTVHLQNIRIPAVEYEVPMQRGKAPPSLLLERGENGAASRLPLCNWGEAIDVNTFYGREAELLALERWVVQEQCRLVALLSRGGFGKTALAVKLMHQVAPQFDFVLWRSLQHAPPLERLLAECITFLSREQKTTLPESVEERISLLLYYLRQARCLLVLDNAEIILQERKRAGKYRAGYEAYGRLFQQIGQTVHQSCLLLTSREKPKEVALLEGKQSTVRTLVLTGLEQSACRELLRESDVFGPEIAFDDLIARYSGIPLALKLVASTIREVFGGNVAAFLKEGIVLFGDIRDLLDQQFKRLSAFEQAILCWLALAREWVRLSDLIEESSYLVPQKKVLEALEALRRRCLLERGEAGAIFTLHPVVMDYVTERVVKQVVQEITRSHLKLMLSHALMKAQAKEHVRSSQVRLNLEPVLHRLLSQLKSEQAVEHQLLHVLATLRDKPGKEQSYGGGNVINLLAHLKGSLQGFDCSRLHIRQAYFVGVNLQETNFTGSSFDHCMFSETFSSIFSVTFSPDDQFLAAGSANGEVRVWQLDGYRQVLSGHQGWVWSVAFSPDGARLASGGEDRLVRIWQVSTGHCLRVLQGHTDWIRSVAFSPDDSLLASSSDDGTVRVWEVSTGACLKILQGHSGRVWSVAFSPDGARLVSGHEDGMVRLWEVSTGACLATLQGHTGRVWSVAFSSNGATLASGGNDGTVRLWEVSTGACLATLQGHTGRVTSVAFSPDGARLASGSDDRMVRLWEVSTGACLATLQGHTDRVWSVAFSPDGARLVSSSDDWTVRLWEVSTRQCLMTLRGYAIWITSAAFSPDSSRFAAGSPDGTVKMWEVSTGQCLMTLSGHTNWLGSVVFSLDGTLLASGSHDTTIRVWEVSTGECLKSLQGHTDFVCSVAFSPDGARLASGSFDTTIRVWEVSTGECLKVLQGHTSWMGFLVFSPDGRLLASGNHDQTVRLWDVRTGDCLKIVHGHSDWVRSVAFSPNGMLLASGSYDRTIRLWDVHTGDCLKMLHGHSDWVESVAFSPDGTLLASGGHNGTVSVWDVSSGTWLRTLHSHPSRVCTVGFSLDGSSVISASEDRTIIRWNVRTGERLQMARNRLYERMNITGIAGLTKAQKATLRELGAVEEEASSSHSVVLQEVVQ